MGQNCDHITNLMTSLIIKILIKISYHNAVACMLNVDRHPKHTELDPYQSRLHISGYWVSFWPIQSTYCVRHGKAKYD